MFPYSRSKMPRSGSIAAHNKTSTLVFLQHSLSGGTAMDMQLPHALLNARETPSLYRTTEQPEFFFSDQLCAHYDQQTRAIWSRWRPQPRPSFNPSLLQALSAYC